MIIALAGRRVDAADAKDQRFPPENVDKVRQRVRAVLKAPTVTVLVSSAACGADLIALSEAGSLGIRRRVVLPSARERFKETSVIDRPGNWGPLYDLVMDEVESKGDLMVDTATPEDDYAAANFAILNEATRLSQEVPQPVLAALVWDGVSRGGDDMTQHFGTEARELGLPVVEVNTM
jgi:hypothetical protein